MPVLEFPAVSQSRLPFWNQPQYTQSGMFIFTILFGIFGLHHLLLRSPQTMLLFLIGNFFTLGYWWFYDIIQLSPYGGNTTETLNTYGLDHPWGPLGLAQGMWKEDPGLFGLLGGLLPGGENANAGANKGANAGGEGGKALAPPARRSIGPAPSAPPAPPPERNNSSDPTTNENVQKGGGGKEGDGPPSPWWFFFYSIFLFLSPVAALIAGDRWLAFDKFVYLGTPLLGGWILYILSLVYDYWMLFVQTGDLLLFGAKRFFPFANILQPPDGYSKNLTSKKPIVGCPPDNILQTGLKVVGATALPVLNYVAPGAGTILETGITAATTATAIAKDTAVSTVEVGGKVAHLAAKVPVATVKGVASAAPKAIEAAKEALVEKAKAAVPLPPQLGGGLVRNSESFTAVDWAALGSIGALIGGGILLSMGRTLRSHYVGPTDAPPFA